MFEISQTQNKAKSNIKTIYHGKVTETYAAEILQNKIYNDNIIYSKTSINEVI